MNVLWIEDFGLLNSDSATLVNFFNGLIPSKVFNNHWNPETDLLSDPAELNRFFEHHSNIHVVTLARHYGDFLDLSESSNLLMDHDVIAIDINLSNGVPKDVVLPDGHTDPEAFHRKAGIYIYNQLIRSGFPDDHICFLTGEKESTFKEFSDHCRNALMPLPNAFGKEDAGMESFRRWLDNHCKSDYTTLRRGVIEGCKMLRRQIAEHPESIQYNKFLESDAASPTAIDDYLFSLLIFLAPKCPSETELPNNLRLFARATAHEWESKVKPSNPGDSLLRGLGWVMKETRNCLAHNRQALSHLTPQDAAYLFVVSMRAMFTLPVLATRFEAIILSLFDQERLNRLPDKNQIETSLRNSHERLLNAFVRHGGEKLDRNFRELANKTDERRVADIDYLVLLYQILWHQLAQRGKTDDAAGYNCNCRPQTFGQNGDFLNMLLSSIYSRSFPA